MTSRVVLPVALILALFGSAAAEERVRIAILGLEVAGTIDIDSTNVARTLTEVMRKQVKGSKYMLAPSSAKELIDEKVANDCANEAATCMSKIAKKLNAQVLIFGNVERKQHDGAEAYLLSLKLLDSDKPGALKPMSMWITMREVADGANGLDPRAVEAFTKIMSDKVEPTVGNNGNNTTTVVPPIETKKKTPPKPGSGWRTATYVTGAATVVLAGGFVYSWKQLSKTGGSFPGYGDNCTKDGSGGFVVRQGSKTTLNDCKNGGLYTNLTYITGIGMGVVGGVALYAAYKGFIAQKEAREQPNQTVGKSTRKRERFAVTPVVSPDGAGATVRFDW
jgi:hypothetical protein